LLLATSILLPDPVRVSDDPTAQYLEAAPTGFALLALAMLWLPGMDVLFGSGLQAVNIWNLAALALFPALAMSSSRRFHGIGAVIAWALFLSLLAARALGLVT
jgi:hypothetical protein